MKSFHSKAQLRIGAVAYGGYVAVLAALWLGVDRSPWLLGLAAAVAMNMVMFTFARRATGRSARWRFRGSLCTVERSCSRGSC